MSQEPDVGARAKAVIERLSKLAPARSFRRAEAESALAEHLRALGLDPRPVRWIKGPDRVASASRGFIAAWEAFWPKKGYPSLVGATNTASFYPLYRTGLRKVGLIKAAEKEEKSAGRSAKRAAKQARKAVGKRLEALVPKKSGHDDLERAVRDALKEKGVRQLGLLPQTADAWDLEVEQQVNEEISKGDAVAAAAEAALWLARAEVLRADGHPADALESVARVYLALVDAVEAGLWLFWVTEDDVVAVSA